MAKEFEVNIKMDEAKFKSYIIYHRYDSEQTLEQIAKRYDDDLIAMNDINISEIFAQVKNANRKAHLKIIVDQVLCEDTRDFFAKYIHDTANIIPIDEWIEPVLESGRGDILYSYAFNWVNNDEKDPYREAFLKLEPNRQNALVAVKFAFITPQDKQAPFEEFVKKSKYGAACIQYARIVKHCIDIFDLLKISYIDRDYSDIVSLGSCSIESHSGLDRELVEQLQYFVLKSKNAEVAKDFLRALKVRGNIESIHGLSLELLLNEIALYSENNNDKASTYKDIQTLSLNILLEVEYDKIMANTRTYTNELTKEKNRSVKYGEGVSKILDGPKYDIELPFS